MAVVPGGFVAKKEILLKSAVSPSSFHRLIEPAPSLP